MDRTMKVFFIFCFAVFFFAACKQNKNDTKIHGPGGGGSQKQNKMNEKAVPEKLAKEIAAVKTIMRQGNGVFRALWPVAIQSALKQNLIPEGVAGNPSDEVDNIFAAAFDVLDQKYDDNGQLKDSSKTKAKAISFAKKKNTKLLSSDAKNSAGPAQSLAGICTGDLSLDLVETQSNDKKTVHQNLYAAHCENGKKIEESVRLFSWDRDPVKGSFRIYFDYENWEILGMATTRLSPAKNDIVGCLGDVNAQNEFVRMYCLNISRNVNSNKAISFQTFRHDKTQEFITQITAVLLGMAESMDKQTLTKIEITDNIKTNSVVAASTVVDFPPAEDAQAVAFAENGVANNSTDPSLDVKANEKEPKEKEPKESDANKMNPDYGKNQNTGPKNHLESTDKTAPQHQPENADAAAPQGASAGDQPEKPSEANF